MSSEAPDLHQQTANLMAQAFALVKACPEGRVTTYSWIGRALGYPRGARMIGWFMNKATSDVPAQRVINSKGELSGSWAFGSPDRMRQLLEAEGITFKDDGSVDLKRYGWDPASELSLEERAALLRSAGPGSPPTPDLLRLMQFDPASPFKK